MRKCLAWALLPLLFLPGCSSKGGTEERLTALEQTVEELRLTEPRLALLEDRVNALSADVGCLRGQGAAPEGVAKGTHPRSVTPKSAEPKDASAAPVAKEPRRPAKGKARDAAPAPSAPARGERAEYARALSLLEAGKGAEARTLFTAFLEAHPSGSLAPNAGYWLGECEYSQKHYDKAILAFKNVIGKFPKHPKAAACLLKAGYAYERLGDKENARFYLNTLLEDFPASEPAGLARKKLATLR